MQRRSIWQITVAMAMGANVVVLAAAQGWPTASAQAPAGQSKTDPKINEPFKKPDVKAFIKKFESDDREIYAKRNEIVAALELTPGMTVADVGAGTGLFTRLFAEKVGKTGKVYAVDISPRVPGTHRRRGQETGRKQVVTVQGTQDTTNLPKDSVDLAFLATYITTWRIREKILASIRQALKPEGKLVVVDFDRVEGRSSEFVLKHVRAGQDVFPQGDRGGRLRRISTAKPPAFKENFFLPSKKLELTNAGRSIRGATCDEQERKAMTATVVHVLFDEEHSSGTGRREGTRISFARR